MLQNSSVSPKTCILSDLDSFVSLFCEIHKILLHNAGYENSIGKQNIKNDLALIKSALPHLITAEYFFQINY
jgi:hypothetical protein